MMMVFQPMFSQAFKCWLLNSLSMDLFIYLLWHWLIKLHRFQLYNSITHHLYIVLCVHLPKSSLLLSPFSSSLLSSTSPITPHPSFPLVITILFSVTVRYFSFSFFFFLLNPFTFSPSAQSLSNQTAVRLFYVSMSLFLFCLLVYFVH